MAYDVTNTSKGYRFVGAVGVDAGDTLAGVELTEDQALQFGELDGVTVKEVKKAK